MDNGTSGLVPAGTTGESPTLIMMSIKELLIYALMRVMEKFL